jgi:hypothetical protein
MQTTPPTWTNVIKGYFTQDEIQCMLNYTCGALNLGDYDSVKGNAPGIYQQVSTGQMPKGGTAWTSDMVSTFKTWQDQGCPEV